MFTFAQPFDPLRVATFTHNFHQHPLAQLDSLRDLARRLQAAGTDKVKFINPSTREDSRFVLATESFDGKSIDQVFDDLHQPGSWIAIYEARTDSIYAEFIDSVIGAADGVTGDGDLEIFDSDAYIFISSAPSVTPFHIDRENNFWLQLSGTKRLTVWDPEDRSVVSQKAVEGWIVRSSLAGVHYSGEDTAVVNQEIVAGSGVFMPSTSPHMTNTETSGQISVSVGVVYYSRRTRRNANIHALNAVLRKLGLEPTAPGERPLLDKLKYPIGWLAIRVFDKLGVISMPRGF